MAYLGPTGGGAGGGAGAAAPYASTAYAQPSAARGEMQGPRSGPVVFGHMEAYKPAAASGPTSRSYSVDDSRAVRRPFEMHRYTSTRSDSVFAYFSGTAAVHTGQYPSGASAIDEEGEESGPLAPLSGKKAAGPRRGAALSGVQASVNLVKCAIGAGSFSLPYAFAQGGLLFSFVGTILLGAISAYTVTMLAQCERTAWANRGLSAQGHVALGATDPGGKSKFTYAELGRRVFDNWTMSCGRFSINFMEVIIYAGIVLTALGVCAAYVDFITSTIPEVFPILSVADVTLIIAPIIFVLALLRTYKFLAFTSVIGDIAVTTGIIAVIIYGTMHSHHLTFDLPQFEPTTFPKWFGSTCFLFAIHIVVLPIMQSMRNRDGFRKVTYGSYFFITLINAVFGALAYMLFGAATAPNVVHNLSKSIFLDFVKILLCVDLLFSVPIILAAAREVVEEAAVEHMTRGVEWARNGIRTVLVIAIFAICFGVPDFSDMVGLVGGFVNSLMGFVLPPLIYMKQRTKAARRSQGDPLSWTSIIGHGAIVIFGTVALVVSTYYTLDSIINPKKS